MKRFKNILVAQLHVDIKSKHFNKKEISGSLQHFSANASKTLLWMLHRGHFNTS